MKTRSGFVSNSSSSSFLISKHTLSPHQINLILDHIKHGPEFFIEYCEPESAWSIEETKYYIKGHTMMDNFDMDTYLERIGVDEEAIEWQYG
jgi:hypothetical protein